MKRLWLILAAVLFACGPVAAQETKPAAEIVDPTATEWTLEKLDNPPTREIKFERSDQPLAKVLSRPDVKLLEQKYVAVVRLEIPKLGGRLAGVPTDIASRMGSELYFAKFLGGRPLAGEPASKFNDKFKDGFERIIKLTPKDRLPAADVLSFFTGPEVDEGYVSRSSSSSDAEKRYTEIRILAPTPEVAEARVTALLQLLDQGSFRAIRTAVFKAREELIVEWKETQQKLVTVEPQLAEVLKKKADFDEFTSDMLTGLRLQLLQLDVDLAGAKARLATCEKLIKDLPANSARQVKVEEVKLTTTIELAGIEASRLKSSQLIETMKTKNELAAAETKLARQVSSLRSQLESLSDNVKRCDAAIEFNAPMQLVDGKVLIQPVLWTQ